MGGSSCIRWVSCFPHRISHSFFPPLGSYFDFIDRLWLQNPTFEKLGRKRPFPCHKNFKPSKKPSNGEKLPNWHSGITAVITSRTLSRKDFLFYYKKLLQELFRLTALLHCPGSSAGIPDLTKPLLPFLIWPLYLYKAWLGHPPLYSHPAGNRGIQKHL